MWSCWFWKATAERAIKSFAQALALALGAEATGVIHANWWKALSAAGAMGVLSVLTSIGSAFVPTTGPQPNPSLVNTTGDTTTGDMTGGTGPAEAEREP